VRPTPEQIGALPLFESLSPDELRAVASLTELRVEDAGVCLAGENASGYSVFVLVSGTAVVTSGGEELTTLGTGDFFGEIALLGEGRRTATVTAASPVSLVVMSGSDFRVFERDFPEMSAVMKRAMAERLARTQT
jgi:CRP/FNR family transcriptional regulator, cyclic AMP receptor protein